MDVRKHQEIHGILICLAEMWQMQAFGGEARCQQEPDLQTILDDGSARTIGGLGMGRALPCGASSPLVCLTFADHYVDCWQQISLITFLPSMIWASV